MQITEPTTMLTDYLLAVLTGYFALKLLRSDTRQRSVRLWGGAFLATAAAALLGGTSHGFALHFDDFWKTLIWKATVYAIGLASFFMLSGTIMAVIKAPARKWLLAAAIIQLLIYAGWMINHDDFRYVIYDYLPAMLAVIALQVYAYFRANEKSAAWIIAGILISFLAAGIQQSGLTLHQHFNHNDLYHVIQVGAIYLLFRGASLLKDR